MNSKKLSFIAIILLLTTGCTPRGRMVTTPNYIKSYAKISGIRLYWYSPLYEYGHLFIVLTSFENSYDYNDTGRRKEVYDSLCIANGDVSYNRPEWIGKDHLPPCAYFPNLCKIDVVSDKDYDETHPAGASLGDCITIKLDNYYDYIASNYAIRFPETTIKKYLSDLLEKDLCLLCADRYEFYFAKLPESEKVHTFTVKIDLEDGRHLEASCEYPFE